VSALTGTPALVRLVLRRDRVRLPVWVGSLVAITYASGAAVADTYDTPVKIASYAANIGDSPVSIATAGPPVALDTIGGILVLETSLTALVGVALMAVFTVVRHTRAEEEAGRTELLVSAVVGRHAGAAAALLVTALAAALVGLGVTASMVSQEVALAPSALYGASVTALGLVFAAVAVVTAQLMTHARGAIGLSLTVLAVAFLLRAVGDVRGNFLTWLTPMGWSQQVRILDGDRWWPLALSLGLCGVLLAVGRALATRRDVGSGILPARPGPAQASPALSSSAGLAWRQQRGTVLAWSVGTFVMGLMFGSLTSEMQNMVRDNPRLAEYFEATGGTVTDSLFATALLFGGLAAGGFAVSSALRLHQEEVAGRLEPVLATGLSRTRALAGTLAVTGAGSLAVVLAGGAGLAVAYARVSGDAGEAVQLGALALVHEPAVLVLVGLAVFLTGWAPRLVLVAWAVVALAFVVGWLGGLLSLPAWVAGLSPYDHVPAVPVDDVAAVPLLGLTVVAAALVAAGAAGLNRRDIG
jgi:ABC-2 type transport system permease protein